MPDRVPDRVPDRLLDRPPDRLLDRLADQIGEAVPVGALEAGRDQLRQLADLLAERADRLAEGLPVGAFHRLSERGAEPFAELLPELFEAIPVDFAVRVFHVLELLRPGVPFLFVECVLEGRGELLAPFLPALADLFPVLAVGLPVGVLEAAAEAFAPFLPTLAELLPALVVTRVGMFLGQERSGNEGDEEGERQGRPAMAVEGLHVRSPWLSKEGAAGPMGPHLHSYNVAASREFQERANRKSGRSRRRSCGQLAAR